MRIFPHQLFHHPSSEEKRVLQSTVRNLTGVKGVTSMSLAQNIEFKGFLGQKKNVQNLREISLFFFLFKRKTETGY